MVAYQIDPSDNSFTQILNRILFDVTLTMGARLTYAALVEHYRDNDKCWPSMARLATMVGCCARTIQNYMQELITRGLVTVIKRGCWKRANEYALHALVPPRAANESQPAPGQDMRNRGAGDTRNRPSAQLYPTNTSSINNWKRKAKEAGAMDFIRRELARRAGN
jgi:DNA-binding transcriptional MocR family regulator